jgi:ribosomal protein S18 acetylase RimI-like enzyme
MLQSRTLHSVAPLVAGAAVKKTGAAPAAPVCDILKEAFSADPFVRWMFPEPSRYERSFAKLASAFGGAGLANGTVDVDEQGRAAALWLPPGQDASIPLLVSSVLTGVRARQWPTLAMVLLAMLRAKPRDPHWYLAMIGTRRAEQGRGFGSSLLRQALDRCDRAGRAAYLEATSPENVALYERHGFRRLPEIRIGSAPALQPMIRSPQ